MSKMDHVMRRVREWRGEKKRRQDYREAFDAESGYGNPSVPSGESSSHTTSIMNERYLVQWKTELNWHTDLLP